MENNIHSLVGDILKENADQRTADWHNERLSRLTASIMWKVVPNPNARDSKKFLDAHFGFHKGAVTIIRQKAAELYTGKTIVDELDGIPDVAFGKNFEAAAFRFHELMRGESIIKSPPFKVYEKNKETGGSSDFLGRMSGSGETKCTPKAGKQIDRLTEYPTLSDMMYADDKTLRAAYWQVHANALFHDIKVVTIDSFCPLFLEGFDPRTGDMQHLDFSPEYAFENTTEKNKRLALLSITEEANEQVLEIIHDTCDRFVRLRNRYVDILNDLYKGEQPITEPIPFKIG